VLSLALAAPGPTAPRAEERPSAAELRDARRTAEEEHAAAEAAARAAREATEAERRLAERRVAAAHRVQKAERRLDAALECARAAEAAHAAAEAEVARRAETLAPLVPVMRRLGLWPAETLLAVPAEPEEALRGALVLQSLVRQLRQEAEGLRAAQAEAARRSATAAAEAARLAEAGAEARSAAAALDADLAAARARRDETRDAEAAGARRAQEAAARAADLADVVARLEQEAARAAREKAAEEAAAAARERAAAARRRQAARRRAAPEPEPSDPPDRRGETAVATAQPPPPARGGGGGRVVPVAGRIRRDFGDATEAGPARGLTFTAPPGARVVSPCAGRAVFSGPFRSYGLLMIVDCGGGYHVVLAGLDRLDAAVGARLLAGEPVGVLGEGDGGNGGRGSLHLELRRRGEPVDPRPWLAGRG
jgi:septal ring factor EnvC (AmiA/AmiB activator)